MTRNFLFIILTAFLCSCGENTTETANLNDSTTESSIKDTERHQAEFAIIIHGGAGTILKKNMTPEMEDAYKATLEEAIRTGYDILKNGGSSLDAVTKTDRKSVV